MTATPMEAPSCRLVLKSPDAEPAALRTDAAQQDVRQWRQNGAHPQAGDDKGGDHLGRGHGAAIVVHGGDQDAAGERQAGQPWRKVFWHRGGRVSIRRCPLRSGSEGRAETGHG